MMKLKEQQAKKHSEKVEKPKTIMKEQPKKTEEELACYDGGEKEDNSVSKE